VFDLYAPEALESLASWKGRPGIVRKGVNALIVDRLAWALRTGDHFLCAGERQRDLWRGAMLGEGLASDTDGQDAFSVVPFGLSETPPLRTDRPGPRTQFPEIGASDPMVLWNGGLWEWLDPLTVIRAMTGVAERIPGTRLVFMGKATHQQAQRATKEARELAASLGLLDRTIFFNDTWVPYADRANWLLDADCAVSAHHDHLETRFAFRTRLLDCFWSGLPVVCTEGDDLADRVARDELGATVAAGDVNGMAAALEGVLRRGRGRFGPALARVAADYTWPVATEPLVRYVTDPPPSRRLSVAARQARPGRFIRGIGVRVARAAAARTGGRIWPGGTS
jgi:glycosyltransferase involved in cell wall biosynthesis